MHTPSLDQMIYVSPAYEELWGRSRESLYVSPKSFLEGIHPEDREIAIAKASAWTFPRNPLEDRILPMRPDGSMQVDSIPWVSHQR